MVYARPGLAVLERDPSLARVHRMQKPGRSLHREFLGLIPIQIISLGLFAFLHGGSCCRYVRPNRQKREILAGRGGILLGGLAPRDPSPLPVFHQAFGFKGSQGLVDRRLGDAQFFHEVANGTGSPEEF